MFFQESFMNDRRRELLDSLHTFQYQVDRGAWRTGTVNRKEIVGTDVVIFVNAPSEGREDVITAVRVYDSYGRLAGQQSVNLVRKSFNSGLLRFTFPLIEE